MSDLFKVGDRVRYIGQSSEHVVYGAVGTVSKIYNDLCNININNEEYCTLVFNIEKVSELEQSMVNSPKHYQILPGIQVRDVANTIADRLGKAGYTGGFISDYVQMLQYLLRFDQKGSDLQDLEKAKKYLDWLIADLELRNEA